MASVTDLLAKVRGTAEDETLLSYLNQCFSAAQQNRMQFEKQWYTNIAFYFGRQWVQWTNDWNSPTTRLHEPIAPPWRVRMVSNQIRRYVRKELAKVTSEAPSGYCLPASSDDADVAAARAGELIIEHEWRELHVKREVRRAAWWDIVVGTGFIKDFWDPNAWIDPGIQGSVQVESVTPFNIFVMDVLQEEIERQECVIHAMSKSPDWVEQQFGVKVPSEGKYSEGGFEDKFMSAMGVNVERPKQVAYIKEAWFKPSARFPQGDVITWCGDRILYRANTWPLKLKEYPFTRFEHIPTGRFYGEASVTDLIPLQKEYNKSRSMIHEAKNRTAMPQMVAPKGSINVKKVTSEPGLIIEYQPGMNPPDIKTPPNIPAYMINELDRIKGDMDDIASQHEVSRGQTPPNVEAATAISFLQEQDDTALANTTASIEEGCEKIGRHVLQYVNMYWDQERIVRVIGYNSQFEAFQFTKESLNGTTAYHVISGSAQPRSLAAKQAFLFEIADRQLIPPEKVLRYLEMPDSARLYEEMQIDNRQAQRENLKMIEQLPAPVNEWDNHVAHVLEHDNYRKRQEFENSDPMLKQIYAQHVQQHKILFIAQNGIPLEYIPMIPGPPDPNDPTGQPTTRPDPIVLDSYFYRLMMRIPIPELAQPNASPVGSLESGGAETAGGQV